MVTPRHVAGFVCFSASTHTPPKVLARQRGRRFSLHLVRWSTYAVDHTRATRPSLVAPSAPETPAGGDHCMQLRRLLAGAGLLLALAVHVPRAVAQDAPQSLPADIRAGSCAEPGDSVAALNPLVVPEGESQGPNGATPVAQSVTDVAMMVPDMLGATNSLMVYASPDQTGAPIVCGEIGGVIGDDGSLTIGLQATEGGQASGLASFAPNRKGDGTTVSVNLIDEGSNHERADNATDGSGDAGDGGHGGKK